MTEEEQIKHMENPEAPQSDRDILYIAKHIEVSCEPVRGGAFPYERAGNLCTMDGCWDLLSSGQKYERLKQAKGAWEAIQSIGIETVMGRAFECYIQEK